MVVVEVLCVLLPSWSGLIGQFGVSSLIIMCHNRQTPVQERGAPIADLVSLGGVIMSLVVPDFPVAHSLINLAPLESFLSKFQNTLKRCSVSRVLRVAVTPHLCVREYHQGGVLRTPPLLNLLSPATLQDRPCAPTHTCIFSCATSHTPFNTHTHTKHS